MDWFGHKAAAERQRLSEAEIEQQRAANRAKAAARAKQIQAVQAVKAEKAKVVYNQGLIKTFKKKEYQTGKTHVDHLVKKTGLSVEELKKVPSKHPGRDAKSHHPAHMGGHRPSIDIAGRISGKVGNNYYWHNHRVSPSYFNHARLKAKEKGHELNKQKSSKKGRR